MNDFKFACIYCGQHILCAEALRGTVVDCPGCKHSLTVPLAAGRCQRLHQGFASGSTLNACFPVTANQTRLRTSTGIRLSLSNICPRRRSGHHS